MNFDFNPDRTRIGTVFTHAGEEPRLVASVLRALWAYRCGMKDFVENDPGEELRLNDWIDQFTTELEQASALPLEAAKHACMLLAGGLSRRLPSI